MIRVPLTRGLFVVIDDADLPLLGDRRWVAMRSDDRFYAAQRELGRRTDPRHFVLLHRFLLSAPKGAWVDHINGDSLDCRRTNLRFATPSQNAANGRAHKDGSSRFKGVSLVRKTGKWKAQIRIPTGTRSLGQFESETEAAVVYDQAARQRYGEFARPNFEAPV